MHLLDTEIKKAFSKNGWNLNISFVEAVREYDEQLADLFLNIINNLSERDTKRYIYVYALYYSNSQKL